MKYYTRNTHDFNNRTREWEYKTTFNSHLENLWAYAANQCETLGIKPTVLGEWRSAQEIFKKNVEYFGEHPEYKPNNFSLALVEKELAELEIVGAVKSKEV